MTKEAPKEKSNIDVAYNEKKPLEVKQTAFSKVLGDNFSVYVPIVTVSESNVFEHWAIKNKRKKAQREMVKLTVPTQKYPLPLTIHLTRISPRNLDGDNLVSSLKTIRDAVAEKIKPGLAPGRADDDKKITWQYSQEKGKTKQKGVRISFIWE